MKHIQAIITLTLIFFMTGCSDEKIAEKGFQVGPISDQSEIAQTNAFNYDTTKFETRPVGVLLTGVPNVRLTTIYKVNVNRKDSTKFTGSDNTHYRYEEEDTDDKANNWNDHLMPGLESVYGYNMVNVSHYDIKENVQKNFFENPVLIKTLYYPSFSKDTLNNVPVHRDYFIVSVYNDDTNKDGFINLKDLRRFYLFNIHGEKIKPLIPENYSVFKSKYDPENDFMFVFAHLDSNNDGRHSEEDPIHIFWIDLKDPTRSGRQY